MFSQSIHFSGVPLGRLRRRRVRHVSCERLVVAGKEHPLIRRLASQSWRDSVENYLGVNTPRSLDPNAPVDGFS